MNNTQPLPPYEIAISQQPAATEAENSTTDTLDEQEGHPYWIHQSRPIEKLGTIAVHLGAPEFAPFYRVKGPGGGEACWTDRRRVSGHVRW